MFGIVSTIVVGLLRSLYGLTAGVTGAVMTVIGSLQLSDVVGNIRFRLDTQSVLLMLDAGSGRIEWRSSNLSSLALGIRRLANNVLGVYGAGDTSDPAWIQQSAGRLRAATSQTVTDSASLVAATGFSATLIAGRTYSFHGKLFTTCVATSGVKIDFAGGTVTATDFHGAAKFFTASGVAVVQTAALNTALGSTAVVLEVDVAGTITVNTAGTFIMQIAQNAETGAAESVVLLRGSYLNIEDMP